MSTVPAIVFADNDPISNPYVRPAFTGLIYRGAWSSANVYGIMDVVGSGGSVWTALAANSNVTPGSNSAVWTVLIPSGGGVTSVAATVPSFLTVAGSPITGSGTLAIALATQSAAQVFAGPTSGSAAPAFRSLVGSDLPNITVNAQTGTTYTVAATDRAGLITLSNAASVAVTVPQATGSFGSGWYADVENIGAGTVTLTPTTSTIDGAASLTLKQFQSVTLVSNGTNWVCLRSKPIIVATTVVAHNFVTAIAADGTATLAQPAASDLSNGVTGTGAVVLATSPTLVTPALGVATATSVNKVTITAPATGSTLTIQDGTTVKGPASVPAGALIAFGVPTFQKFTSSGTFTIPTGVTGVKVTVVGGGGAGGGSTAANNGGGGGTGGIAIKWLTGLTAGNTLTVTIGAGGTGVSGANGNGGSASSIASGTQTITTVTASGGGSGFTQSGSSASPGIGGGSTNGDINGNGVNGYFSTTSLIGGQGGSTFLGGGGNGGPNAAGGSAAANTGSGGGGAGGPGGVAAGGNGAAGIVVFEWVQ